MLRYDSGFHQILYENMMILFHNDAPFALIYNTHTHTYTHWLIVES